MATVGRIEMIKRSIQCYCDQIYENKELVIVTNSGTKVINELIDCISSFNRNDIYLRTLTDRKYTLGELRNFSIREAVGEIICIWDDDDLYHPERLTMQYNSMNQERATVSLLSDHLQFFWDDLVLAWVDWKHNRQPLDNFPASLMMYKRFTPRYPEKGKNANKGEDSALLKKIQNEKLKVASLANHGYLYLYSYHGTNTWSKKHHQMILGFPTKNGNLLPKQKKQFKDALDYFSLPNGIKIL